MSHTAVSPPQSQSLDPTVAAARSLAGDGVAFTSTGRTRGGEVAPAGSSISASVAVRGSAVDAVRRARAERGTRVPRLAGRAGTTVVRSAGGRLVALPTGRAA